MNVLVIGSGGREHALAWKIAQSPRAGRVFSCVAAAAGGKIVYTPADLSGNDKVISFVKENNIALVVIGPEAPLAGGMADALKEAGIKVFGTIKAGARLEYSKEYSKEFMQKYNVPTAAYKSFTDIKTAEAYVNSTPSPIVIKADGLAAGKGVRVCTERGDALNALKDFMELGTLGASGSKVVIEEFLDGREASIMAFVDGESYTLLPVSRDHKRLLNNDLGPNTGGMGVYSPAADITPQDMEFIKTNIFDNTLKGLKAENIDFCGIIYAGIMKGSKGIKVLEYNCRFGDPETQTVLPLLEGDLLETMLACTDKRLKDVKISTQGRASVCVIMAGKDYPAAPSKGLQITGLEQVQEAAVFHCGTKAQDGKFYTNGGRVLAIAAFGKDISQAREKVYSEIKKIHFDGAQYRTDIGEQI